MYSKTSWNMFDLYFRYMQEYNKDPKYSYPIITWDLLPHAGASQVHPHLQMLLSPDKYPGKMEYYMYMTV